MQLFYFPCKIERGGFSSERTFEVTVPSGDKLLGAVGVEYLRDRSRRPLDNDTPSSGDAIPGFVQCRVLKQVDAHTSLVEFPSADITQVQRDELVSLN
jgi:hypothetical protein